MLNQNRTKNLLPINVLIQVNVSKEINKNGVHNIDKCQKLAKLITSMPNLILRGIMAMPAIKENVIKNKIQYKKINAIFKELKKIYINRQFIIKYKY